MTRSKILQVYKAHVTAAYKELALKINSLKKSDLDKMAFDKAVRAAAGRCGALCSAAIKRASRDHLVALLLIEHKRKDLDITPTVAQHVCDRVLGRGVDNRKTLEAFATAGRTAADKSTLGASDLVEIEEALRVQVGSIRDSAHEIKAGCVADYKAGKYSK
jgi:hypothetical protein